MASMTRELWNTGLEWGLPLAAWGLLTAAGCCDRLIGRLRRGRAAGV